MIFRKVTEGDVESVMSIIRDAQAQMKRLGSQQWQNGYPAKEDVLCDIARSCGYVMCDGDTLVAYSAVVFDGEQAYDHIEGRWSSDEPYVVVHRLAVAELYKQQGMATEFMRRVEHLSLEHGVTNFRIDTNFDNGYMLRMLERLGFSYRGIVHYKGAPRQAYDKLLGE